MARKFLTPVDLAQNELQNARVQNLGSAPGSPAKGQLYYNSTGGNDTLYWWDGSTWQSAKGGVGFGNVTAEQTFGTSIQNGAATTASRSDHAHGNPIHDAAAHSAIPLNSFASPTAGVNMGAQKLVGLAPPTLGTDGANKDYVDITAQGLDVKHSCRCATTANVGLSGLAAIDGVTPIANNRVLVKNQSTPAANGIYLASSGAWTRALDMDSSAEASPGAFVFIEEGTTQADTGWVLTTDGPVTLDTTALNWSQFSGAGTYTAGAGLTQSGSTFNVGAGNGITVNADDVAASFAGNGAANTVARSDHNHDAAYAALARTIATTAPLTGGGDLSANRTLAITSFAGSAAGAVPVSVGGTTNFLRADGTWSAPAGGGTVNKYSISVGGATSVVVNHALGTRDVQVQVYRVASPYDTVECDVERTDTANVTLRFAVAPSAAEYRCVVVA